MKKFLSVLFFVFYSYAAFATSEASIQRRAFNAPDEISQNIRKLTAYLTKSYDNDYDKLKVIAYWISSHVAYDGYKYDNAGGINKKAMNYKYDVLKAKIGICTDFAKLFYEMSTLAGVKNVSIVTGFVVEKVKRLKRKYSPRELPGVGHAWNKVVIDGRAFYVDTTFMAPQTVGASGKKFKSEFKHKIEIKHREQRTTNVNTHINFFFFDFTPTTEFKKYGTHHWNENL